MDESVWYAAQQAQQLQHQAGPLEPGGSSLFYLSRCVSVSLRSLRSVTVCVRRWEHLAAV